jgi:hypothetical protein
MAGSPADARGHPFGGPSPRPHAICAGSARAAEIEKRMATRAALRHGPKRSDGRGFPAPGTELRDSEQPWYVSKRHVTALCREGRSP